MATATGNYVSDNSSLANFQSWTSAIYNAFVTTCGWTQTADTGQAANPIAAVPSSTYVYWIFKASDALAATLPIYVKVELGFSSTSPRIRMTVGTGSNGSGTINGQVATSTPWEITNLETNQGGSVFPCFFSGNSGNFRMYMWQSGAVNTGVVFGIERSKDGTGADTADYFTALNTCTNNSTVTNQQSILPSSVGNRDGGIIGICLTSTSGTGAFGGTVASFPIFPIIGKPGNPMLGFQCCNGNDVTDGSTVTVASLYGGTHTFIAAFKPSTLSRACGERAVIGSTVALLMEYE